MQCGVDSNTRLPSQPLSVPDDGDDDCRNILIYFVSNQRAGCLVHGKKYVLASDRGTDSYENP